MSGTWCVRYSLPQRSIESIVARTADYALVRALVVRDGDPLGYVQFPLPEGELTPDELDKQARAQLGAAYDAPHPAPPPLPEPPPFASVIVCTRNRPAEIAACLTRLVTLDYPNFEIVVVDNAPPDDRARVAIERVAAEHSSVRYVLEPKPGLSHARNRGLAEMRSDIAVYTDDDVAVDRQWLREVVAAFGTDDSVGCVTGMVCTADMPTATEAYFDWRAANWSSRLQARSYRDGSHDLGPLFPYTPGKFGTGANFAFRRAGLEAIGGFDVALGAGTPARGGEDLDAFVRVALLGYAINYTPRAIVWHHHRASEEQLREQMFAWGLGLGAFVVAHLVRPATRGAVLRRVARGFGQVLRMTRGGPDYTVAPRPPLPGAKGMLRSELLGMVLSPWYYATSRRAAARLSRMDRV